VVYFLAKFLPLSRLSDQYWGTEGFENRIVSWEGRNQITELDEIKQLEEKFLRLES